ncbi:MAG: adenosine kinase [Spirochaetota bacterium]|nr:MAG: adenosine kinase [Spirochaetota bacterium]
MHIDISGLGNPLMDILVYVDDDFIKNNNLMKGVMHLIDDNESKKLLHLIDDKKKELQAGGSCPNTMVALALLGLNTALAGKIGNDELGNIYQKKIVEKGVISYLKQYDCDTGTSIILITPDKERTMNTYLSACREFCKEDLQAEMIENSSLFYFTGYMWDTDNQKEATRYAIEVAKSNKVPIVFDVADPMAAERYREDFIPMIQESIDIVLANACEAQILTGKDIEESVTILNRLCPTAVIKNGEKDTLIADKGEVFSIPVFKSNVKDTTGAGDNFAAGFIYGILKGYDIPLCGRIASFVASKTIEKIGAQAPDNIRTLLEEMLESIQPV